MNNFWQRAITGVFFVGAVCGLTLYNEYTFLVLLCAICLFGLLEYYKIVFKGIFHYSQAIFVLIGLGIVCLKYWFSDWVLYLLPVIFPLAAFTVLFSKNREWKSLAYLFSGLFYIAFPLLFFFLSTFKPEYTQESPQTIYMPLLALNLFVLIWCSDTFAYISGKLLGKNKMFEAVSPGKTWEGFFGGLILTCGFSALLAYYFNIPVQVNIIVALCSVVLGTLGDLVESMLKREFKIKDSGNILPGHGGILDRFDALLISLPFTALCYYLLL
jgi:phosphatidate cytidylyltransferase